MLKKVWLGVLSASLLALLGCPIGPSSASAQVAVTEWHFSGDLDQVAGPSRLRFLDDEAFGNLPNGAPNGLTEELSFFGSSDAVGLPPIDGEPVPVFRVPPPRLPGTGQPVTSMGLVLWPGNGGAHPDGLVDEWTIVMDLLIPESSFAPGIITPLINFDDNNGNDADLFIAGPVQGGPPHGRVGPKNQLLPAPAIRPNEWFRLILVVDNLPGPIEGVVTRIYVNGQFIGEAEFAGSLFNMVNPEQPTFNTGEPVPQQLWNRWGQFPSPWAMSPNEGSLLSTATLFSDDDGEGRPVFLAKALLTDTLMSGEQAADLDDPGNDRILLCDADLNGDESVDVFDLLLYLDEWFAGDLFADWTNDGVVDVFDLLLYLDEWFAPCD